MDQFEAVKQITDQFVYGVVTGVSACLLLLAGVFFVWWLVRFLRQLLLAKSWGGSWHDAFSEQRRMSTQSSRLAARRR